MRLGFPNGELDDYIVQGSELRIGNAADNDLVLDVPGVEAHHAVLTMDTRGTILWLLSAQSGAYVNARPVREQAILRLGDSISMGEVRFILKPDSDAQARTESGRNLPQLDSVGQAQQVEAPARAVLRGVSGPFCGQGIPVRNRLIIGSGSDCGVHIEDDDVAEQAWAIESDGRHLLLRMLEPSSRAHLNGIEVGDAALHPGDQVAFGQVHFLIEAPGLPQRSSSGSPVTQREAYNITQTMRAVTVDDTIGQAAVSDHASSLNVWLLIGAALLIAAVITGLMFIEF